MDSDNADGLPEHRPQERDPTIEEEEWTQTPDRKAKKRMQNRVAQRTYRQRMKTRVEELQAKLDLLEGAQQPVGSGGASASTSTSTSRADTPHGAISRAGDERGGGTGTGPRTRTGIDETLCNFQQASRYMGGGSGSRDYQPLAPPPASANLFARRSGSSASTPGAGTGNGPGPSMTDLAGASLPLSLSAAGQLRRTPTQSFSAPVARGDTRSVGMQLLDNLSLHSPYHRDSVGQWDYFGPGALQQQQQQQKHQQQHQQHQHQQHQQQQQHMNPPPVHRLSDNMALMDAAMSGRPDDTSVTGNNNNSSVPMDYEALAFGNRSTLSASGGGSGTIWGEASPSNNSSLCADYMQLSSTLNLNSSPHESRKATTTGPGPPAMTAPTTTTANNPDTLSLSPSTTQPAPAPAPPPASAPLPPASNAPLEERVRHVADEARRVGCPDLAALVMEYHNIFVDDESNMLMGNEGSETRRLPRLIATLRYAMQEWKDWERRGFPLD
ncbi:hypothetical protein A1O3_02707 [Capronia epimyces CBS 606.96]|uniref:BZIP domain-containing protein n=1 Tax=Capronia epimyces CBS 606.96 TaxID=1182542 RepID=W9YIX8_9EURO|nr:uncharacterized protein A1O3_02707 [Capronia epimyces CBS 606.96]EXJ89640.1 hypothetical protein A1O3_02707 [Capronia epimyces CBS 606.96]